ncbi:hypothetical protein D9758_012672 [Tetrapyrgos nigripes]|uniref:Heterokaryon incompatibility domain-containing protein n=1 Tax=Tetrapyrgos nigripes TaxID=182062 RepID=A0A8H5CX57_9AGAR|nr:hypothetical protein D9758_012672 [Tetrapyrgos nigripes]
MAATTMEKNAAKALPKRLVNTYTCRLIDFSENDPTPPYAILSHRWVLGEEVSYQDYLESRPDTKKLGYWKIRRACMVACIQGFDYIWIDTICINQGNHNEVAQNINGMYSFYQHSEVCYAYLADIYKPPGNDGSADLISKMWRSGWFQRGWTLQELVAPRNVVFFSAGWEAIGTRSFLKFAISSLTGIPATVLDGSRPIEDVDIQERMTWCFNDPGLYCIQTVLWNSKATTSTSCFSVKTCVLKFSQRTMSTAFTPAPITPQHLLPPSIRIRCHLPLAMICPTTIHIYLLRLYNISHQVFSPQSGLMDPDLKFAVIAQTSMPAHFTGHPVEQAEIAPSAGILETDDNPDLPHHPLKKFVGPATACFVRTHLLECMWPIDKPSVKDQTTESKDFEGQNCPNLQ